MSILPVYSLAIDAAIISGLAGCANLMLEGLAFWGLTGATEFSKGHLAFSLVFDVLLLFLYVGEPVERGVMCPRVKVLNLGSLYLKVRAFGWTVFVHELMLLLLRKYI